MCYRTWHFRCHKDLVGQSSLDWSIYPWIWASCYYAIGQVGIILMLFIILATFNARLGYACESADDYLAEIILKASPRRNHSLWELEKYVAGAPHQFSGQLFLKVIVLSGSFSVRHRMLPRLMWRCVADNLDAAPMS